LRAWKSWIQINLKAWRNWILVFECV
jgi:hypothetical protein